MLSLKDFKEYEVKKDTLNKISGGIQCSAIDEVLDALDGQPQKSAVIEMLWGGGIQCQWGNNTCTVGYYYNANGEARNYAVC
ncbi:MAG: hypothetical protein IPO98_08005 [Saprospiraceae bacterium]|nr:hypothetical protein [Saprospiraceae bacterium]